MVYEPTQQLRYYGNECQLSGNDVCLLALIRTETLFKMAGTAVMLQLISFFFWCGKTLGKVILSLNALFQLDLWSL